jgi:hypothetical protein
VGSDVLLTHLSWMGIAESANEGALQKNHAWRYVVKGKSLGSRHSRDLCSHRPRGASPLGCTSILGDTDPTPHMTTCRCKVEVGQVLKTESGEITVDNRCWIRSGHTLTQVGMVD